MLDHQIVTGAGIGLILTLAKLAPSVGRKPPGPTCAVVLGASKHRPNHLHLRLGLALEHHALHLQGPITFRC